jgi:hypothetical protein
MVRRRAAAVCAARVERFPSGCYNRIRFNGPIAVDAPRVTVSPPTQHVPDDLHFTSQVVRSRGQVAQVVERSPEKAGVGGSTPSLATMILKNLRDSPRDLSACCRSAVRVIPCTCMSLKNLPRMGSHQSASPPPCDHG